MAKTKTVKMTWLELARRQVGFTQERAARYTGVPLGSWRNWEQRRSTPGILALKRLHAFWSLLRSADVPGPTVLVRVDPETLEIVP